MNWENLPGQMLALLLGWSFTVFIQHRANRRAEALKRKDKIVDKLESIAGWVEDEVSKDSFSLTRTETSYSGIVSQIEVRIRQLNAHIGNNIFDESLIAKLREIEIYESADGNLDVPYKVREASSDIIENIEACSDSEYFGKKGVLSILNDFVSSLHGIALVLICVLLFLGVFQFFYKYVF